jgi:DNA replication protein DnaC
MEKINQIMEKAISKTNINTSKQDIPTWKNNCIICGKEFKYQEEANIYGTGPKEEHRFCSKECFEIYLERGYQRKILAVLPLKYIGIECDRKELIKEGQNESMFITGSVGVGKTVLMAGIVKNILHSEKGSVEWISYPGFIMELQSLYRRDDTISPFERAEDIATYRGTLCIDDLGAEKITDFVKQITYYIINYREQECLHTIVTSNFSLQEIDEQIDSRISSRIAGMCKIVKLEGKDRRLQKKK